MCLMSPQTHPAGVDFCSPRRGGWGIGAVWDPPIHCRVYGLLLQGQLQSSFAARLRFLFRGWGVCISPAYPYCSQKWKTINKKNICSTAWPGYLLPVIRVVDKLMRFLKLFVLNFCQKVQSWSVSMLKNEQVCEAYYSVIGKVGTFLLLQSFHSSGNLW